MLSLLQPLSAISRPTAAGSLRFTLSLHSVIKRPSGSLKAFLDGPFVFLAGKLHQPVCGDTCVESQ
ncbi:hypothetical protein PAMP_023818 [Pampus punctatissimus]